MSGTKVGKQSERNQNSRAPLDLLSFDFSLVGRLRCQMGRRPVIPLKQVSGGWSLNVKKSGFRLTYWNRG